MPITSVPAESHGSTVKRSAAGLDSPRLLFIAGSLLVLLAWTLAPRTRAMLGLFDHGRWFLDSYIVLAASDAAREGLNPEAPNPYDVFHRPHSYSDWWFGLGKLGLTRGDNFLVGGVWVLAFLGAVFLTVRPRQLSEVLWLVLLLGSPPVMLAVMRANNDLVIFAVLAVALLALRVDSGWRLAFALAAVGLAIGLKFYPVAAGFVFLLLRPPRRMLSMVGLATLVAATILASVWSQLQRGTFRLEPEIYTMGAQIWLRDLGLTGRPVTFIIALVLLGTAAAVAVWRGWTSGLARENAAPGSRQAMTMGAAMLVFCFLGTINFGYRWIFALWLAPWLWHHRQVSAAARILVGLLPIILWHDSFLCLATSLWFPNLRPEQYDHIFLLWRLATQPLTWLAMIFLTGWLFELALAGWRDVRREFYPPAGNGRGVSRAAGP